MTAAQPAIVPPKLTSYRPGRGDARDVATLYVFAVAIFALLVSVVAVGYGIRSRDESTAAGSAAGAVASPIEVTLADFKVSPGNLTAASGGTLRVANDGASPHNLAIEKTDLRTAMLDNGAKADLDLAGLAPGTYLAYCEVPGHRAAGMESTLVVSAGPASGSGQAAAGSKDAHAMTTGASAGGPMGAKDMDSAMAAVTAKFPAKTAGAGAQDLAPTVLADGTRQFELTTTEVKWEVEPGRFVDAMAYNGTVPGPTLRVEPGVKVRVLVKNEMSESTAVHIHGIELPNAMDGVPDITQPPIKPGATFAYEFTAQQTPAVGMYHSHHNAAEQVPNGLAGAFLIGNLPTPAGITLASEQVMMLNDAGTVGFSLNGKSFPATAPITAKLGDWILVHYLNEGVMAHPMHLHGMPQLVVAKDGFPLAQPYKADTVNVAPGERYSVLVQATTPGIWAWHCHILPHAERSTGMFGMVTALIVS